MPQQVKISPDYRIQVTKFKPDEKLKYGNKIKDETWAKNGNQSILWQVLIKQYYVVPEIQVGFLVVIMGQCTPTHMIHD